MDRPPQMPPREPFPKAVTWLGRLPTTVRSKGRKIKTDGRENRAVQGCGVILALAVIQPIARYNHFLLLSQAEREQYSWWQRVCPCTEDVDGRLILFEVLRLVRLSEEVPVQQFTDARPHGLVVQMEQGQPQRLLQQHTATMSHLCGDSPPDVLIRLPAAFADSILKGFCSRFFLPDFNSFGASHKYTWHCNWQRLGYAQGCLPANTSPVACLQAAEGSQPVAVAGPGAEDLRSLDLPLLKSISEYVRSYARQLLSNPEDNEDLLATMYRDTQLLQSLLDEMEPASIQSSIRDVINLDGAGSASLNRRVTYRAAFVIQVLLQCDLLVSDMFLQESVKGALALILPKQLLLFLSRW